MTKNIATLIPAMKPPPGEVSNLVNPPSMNANLIVAATICVTCVASAITTRIFVKVHIMKRLHIEDYFLILSGLFFLVFTVMLFPIAKAGQGRHQWNVSLAGLQRIAWLANIMYQVFCPLICFSKLSVLFQMQRIFGSSEKGSVHWTFQALIWSNLIMYTILFFMAIFPCSPREKIWNPSMPGKCIDPVALLITSASFNVVSDVLMICAPIYSIRRLNIPLKKKMRVAVIFGAGIFGAIAAIIRLRYSGQLAETEDITRVNLIVDLWGLAEVALIIIVAALPTLPKFIEFVSGKIDRRPSVGTFTRQVDCSSGRSNDTTNLYTVQTKCSNKSEEIPYPKADLPLDESRTATVSPDIEKAT